MVAYAVRQRIPEIGIGLARSADARHVVALVSRDGMGSVAAGLAAGTVTSVALGKLVGGLPFGVHPGDVPTYLAVQGVLLAVGVAACLVPARRALRADPASAMRAN